LQCGRNSRKSDQIVEALHSTVASINTICLFASCNLQVTRDILQFTRDILKVKKDFLQVEKDVLQVEQDV
jgi:hypothetical protein